MTSELNVLSDSGFSPFAEQQRKQFLIKSTNHLAKNKKTGAKPISTNSFAKAEWRHFLGQEAGVPVSFGTWILDRTIQAIVAPERSGIFCFYCFNKY